MKLNLPAVITIFAGVILIYSGITHHDPRNVVLSALGSKRRVPETLNIGKDVGKGIIAGAKTINAVPDPGVRPPATNGHGPIVSV